MKRGTKENLFVVVFWLAVAAGIAVLIMYAKTNQAEADRFRATQQAGQQTERETKDRYEEALFTGDIALQTIRERLSSWISAGPGFVLTTDRWSEATIYSANTPWSVKCDGRELEVRILGDVDVEGNGESSSGGPRSHTITSRVPKGQCTVLAREAAITLREIFRRAGGQ